MTANLRVKVEANKKNNFGFQYHYMSGYQRNCILFRLFFASFS